MITSRQIELLRLIVDAFIETGLPVGSRTLSKQPKMPYSPATIRNDMADLEEIGFIIQPHVSAGRIPSELGLRYYVDELLQAVKRESRVEEAVRGLLTKDTQQEAVLEKAIQLLRDLTDMTAVVTMPAFNKSKLVNLKLIRVDSTRLMMVLVSDAGDVRPIELKNNNTDQTALDKLAEHLLDKFLNQTIEQISVRQVQQLKIELPESAEIIDYLIPKLRAGLKQLEKTHLMICGIDQLLQYGQFTTMKEAMKLYQLFETPEEILSLLAFNGNGVSIRIGKEIGHKQFEQFSIVKTDYSYSSSERGTIGLIGPIRMNYSKAVYLLETVEATITQLFSGIHL